MQCHAKNHTKFIQRILNGENIAKHFQDPICCNLKDSVVMTVGTSFLNIIVWAGFEFFQQFSEKSSGSDPLSIERSTPCFNKQLVKEYPIICVDEFQYCETALICYFDFIFKKLKVFTWNETF